MPPISELSYNQLPYQDSLSGSKQHPRAASDFYHRSIKLAEIQGEVGKKLTGASRLDQLENERYIRQKALAEFFKAHDPRRMGRGPIFGHAQNIPASNLYSTKSASQEIKIKPTMTKSIIKMNR